MNPNCQVFFDLVSLLNGSADTIHPGRLGRARRSCLGHEWMRKQATSIVVITSTGDTPVSSNLRNPGPEGSRIGEQTVVDGLLHGCGVG